MRLPSVLHVCKKRSNTTCIFRRPADRVFVEGTKGGGPGSGTKVSGGTQFQLRGHAGLDQHVVVRCGERALRWTVCLRIFQASDQSPANGVNVYIYIYSIIILSPFVLSTTVLANFGVSDAGRCAPRTPNDQRLLTWLTWLECLATSVESLPEERSAQGRWTSGHKASH